MNDKTKTKYCIRNGLVRPLLLSLAFGFLYGCSAKEELSGSSAVEIRLGVQGVTRAVNTLDDLSAVGDNLGIYGVGASAASGTVLQGGWSSDNLVMDNVRTSGVDASTGGISWAGSYFYPVGSDRYVRFCAYHPYASGGDFSIETSASGASPRLRFTLSGKEDIMFAGPVTRSASLRPGLLTFRHRLTQLSFCLEDAGGAFSGATLKGIVFTDANASGSMDLESGELGTWSAPKEIAVPGIVDVPITGTPGAPQHVGGEVMLQPGCGSFRLRVVTSLGTFEEVEIRPNSSVDGVPETAFAAGRSYLITLTLKQKSEIALSASVVPWVMAGTGSAVVQ